MGYVSIYLDDGTRLFTLPGMKQADEILKAFYKKAKNPERYKGSFYPGGHKFGKEMQSEASDWLNSG